MCTLHEKRHIPLLSAFSYTDPVAAEKKAPGVLRFGKRFYDDLDVYDEEVDKRDGAPGVMRFGKRSAPGVMRFGKKSAPGEMKNTVQRTTISSFRRHEIRQAKCSRCYEVGEEIQRDEPCAFQYRSFCSFLKSFRKALMCHVRKSM